MKQLKLGLAIVLILAGVLFAVDSFMNLQTFWFGTPVQKLQELWQTDFQLLQQEGKIPSAWSGIQEVKYSFGSPISKEWAQQLKFPLELSKEGEYRVEVFVDHWQDEDHYGAVFQYQTIELSSNNTIHEFGRTLTIGKISDRDFTKLGTVSKNH